MARDAITKAESTISVCAYVTVRAPIQGNKRELEATCNLRLLYAPIAIRTEWQSTNGRAVNLPQPTKAKGQRSLADVSCGSTAAAAVFPLV